MENAEAIEMLNRNPTNAEVSVYIGEENQPNTSDNGKALYMYIFWFSFQKTFRRRRVMENYQRSS